MLKFFKKLFRNKSILPEPVMLPETDLDIINRGLCPDCGVTNMWVNLGTTLECDMCGSGYMVIPATFPYVAATHIGFNRHKRRHLRGTL